jgi:hypothetical protein
MARLLDGGEQNAIGQSPKETNAMNNAELVRKVVSIVERDRKSCSGPIEFGVPRQAKVNAYGIRFAARQIAQSGNSVNFDRLARVWTTLIGFKMPNKASWINPDCECGQADRPPGKHLSESATWAL